MSRSRRHAPKFGITTARSEKDDKVRAHRRDRSAAKPAVRASAQAGDEDAQVADSHPRSGRWAFAKDGKRWSARARPKDMRK